MKHITVIIICVFSLVLISSCSEDDACTSSTLPVTDLESEYGCINTPGQVNIDLTEEYIIIRSQSEFDSLVTGSCTPQIDFVTYDLLIGKKGLVSGLETIDYDGLTLNCNNGQLNLTVTFVLNATTEAPNVTYHVLVPKLEPNESINVTITTVN